MIKRKISILLAVLLLTTLLIPIISAHEADGNGFTHGDGSPEDPFIIYDLQDLYRVRNDLTAHYALGEDIDASSTNSPDYNGGKGWQPIGEMTEEDLNDDDFDGIFSGHFDGRGFNITGLFINDPTIIGAGLFAGIAPGGLVSNTNITGADVTGGLGVGSLAGLNFGNIDNCNTSGKVEGQVMVGGLIGINFAEISDSSFNGNVSGMEGVGGLVGGNIGTICQSYSTGNVSATEGVGGLVGWNGGTIERSHSWSDVSGSMDVGSLIGADYGTVIDSEGHGSVTITSPFLHGDGTRDDPYQIHDLTDLHNVRHYPDSHFILYDDIDASPTSDPDSMFGDGGWGWRPIGSGEHPFTGTFDGADHTIFDLYINRQHAIVGLFCLTSETAEIRNITLSNIHITGGLVGGLVGINEGLINGSYVTGQIISENQAGGLVGVNEGVIEESSSSVFVRGEWRVGGLAGFNDGYIIDSQASGDVEGHDRVGGLVGENRGEITQSSSGGAVSGFRTIGGLVGLNHNLIEGCDAYGDVTGSISVGELIGEDHGTVRDSIGHGSVTVLTLFSEGEGTTDDPYRIHDLTELHNIRLFLDSHFILANDIYASDTSEPGSDFWNHGNGWMPIGNTWSQQFTGTFDGADYTIYDLHINRKWSSNVGLFAYISPSAGIRNVTLSDFNITGYYQVGSLVGYSQGSIDNSSSNGEIVANSRGGGLVGDNNGVIRQSQSYGEVSGEEYIGGLVGHNRGTIQDSSSHSNVIGFRSVGSLAGTNYGDIESCTAWGDVSGYISVGNLIGEDWGQVLDSQGHGSVTILTHFDSGEGTPEDPYIINTLADLDNIRLYLDSHFLLDGDIDASPTSQSGSGFWNGGEGWTPIGNSYGSPFTGTFDGAGHTISNLFINRPGGWSVGLFGYTTSSASIVNVTLSGVDITGEFRVGGLVGHNHGVIDESNVLGNITGEEKVGGLVGQNNGNIINSSANVNVSAEFRAGGLVGHNTGVIYRSQASGEVIGDNQVGGLAGSNYQTVHLSQATSDVSGFRTVGGLVGMNYDVIESSEARGDVTGSIFVGSLTGQDSGNVIDSMGYGTVTVISMIEHGQGTVDDPYQIHNLTDLNHVRLYPDSHFILADDIDASPTSQPGSDFWNHGVGWIPIGVESGIPFNGTFDGADHTISGLRTHVPWLQGMGLFYATSSNAEIRNLTLAGVNIVGEEYVGGLVGYNQGLINGSHVTGGVGGLSVSGGLVGANEGIIEHSSASVDINGQESLGGLVGKNYGTIANSSSTGNVQGRSVIGGLVGLNEGMIVNCSAWSDVSGYFTVGNLIGDDQGSVIDSQGHGIVTLLRYFDHGEGTPEDPFMIYNLADLNNVRLYPDSHFILGDDIDASATSQPGSDFWNHGNGWIPIGDQWGTPFAGTFDGADHTISGLHINRLWTSGIGLFGYTSPTAEICNITLEGVDIVGNDEVGGLVGFNQGMINGCKVLGNISAEDLVGGLVGFNQGIVNGSFVQGNVSGETHVGGLVGYNEGRIEQSSVIVDVGGEDYVGGLVGYNLGNISGSNSISEVDGINDVGGLVGYNLGNISGSHAIGEVLGDTVVGGLVGYNLGNISGSHSIGEVLGDSFVGGLVGYNLGTIKDTFVNGNVTSECHGIGELVGGLVGYNQGNISSSYAQGNVTSEGDDVGGLVGRNSGNITESYALGKVTCLGDAAGGLVGSNSGSISESYAVSRVLSSYIVGGLVAINHGNINDSYAYGVVSGFDGVGGLVGNNHGSISNSFTDVEVNCYNSIAGGLVGHNSGTISDSFASGNVTGFWDIGGLVGHNIGTISDSYALGNVTSDFGPIGGLVGRNSGNINQSYAVGNVTSDGDDVGGLVGSNSGNINQSYAVGNVMSNGDAIGGLIGSNSGNINQSYALGSVNGPWGVGGLAGTNFGIISQSYSSGEVNGGMDVGGLVGHNNGEIIDSYSVANVVGLWGVGGLVGYNHHMITNSYSSGEVGGTTDNIGGLVGVDIGTVTNSYWDMESSKQSDSAGDEAIGKTTVEMMLISTFLGWDFEYVWWIAEGATYPLLANSENIFVISISVDLEPRNDYDQGDQLDLSLLRVNLTWSNGDMETNSIVPFEEFCHYGLLASPVNGTSLNHDDTTVTITHIKSGESATFTITINAVITEVSITQQPKLDYYYGDELDLSDLRVKLVWSDGSITEGIPPTDLSLHGLVVVPDSIDFLDHDDQGTFMIVSHPGSGLQDETSGITVAPIVTGIWIHQLPDRLSYNHSNEFDLSGLQVNITWSDTGNETLVFGTDAFNDMLDTDPYHGRSLSHDNTTVTVTDKEFGESVTFAIVIDPVVTEISIKTNPDKLTYDHGDPLDLDGLSVELEWSDGSITVVSMEDFNGDIGTDPYHGMPLGHEDTTVTVTHTPSGQSATFTITINTKVIDVIITQQPKLLYNYGDSLDLSDLRVKLVWSDGTMVEEIPVPAFVFLGLEVVSDTSDGLVHEDDGKNVTVRHTPSGSYNHTEQISITPAVLSISINAQPTTLEYDHGDTLDLTGLVVDLEWSNGTFSEIALEDFTANHLTVDPGQGTPLTSIHHETAITVTYAGDPDITAMTAEITVNDVVTGLRIITDPERLVYNLGEALDLRGLVIEIEWSDGRTDLLAFDDFNDDILTDPSNGTSLSHDDTTVIVTHTDSGESSDFTITINTIVLEVIIAQQPKLLYNYGDSLDLGDLRVTLRWSDGTFTEEISPAGFAANDLEAVPLVIAPLDHSHDSSITVTHAPSGQFNRTDDITVAPIVTGIWVHQLPDRLGYNHSNEFDLSGLQVNITWSDTGNETLVFGTDAFNEMLDTDPYHGRSLSHDNTTVTVTDKEFGESVTFAIVIDPVVTEISIKTNPDKLTYDHGDPLDLDGLSVELEWSDGSITVVSMEDFNGDIGTDLDNGTPLGHDDTTITVTHPSSGESATFIITINAVITEVNITQQPKLDYYYGDELDLSELRVKLVWSDGSITEGIPPTDLSLYGLVVVPDSIDFLDHDDQGAVITVSHPGSGLQDQSEGITVNAVIISITVNQQPILKYSHGDSLNLSGLVIGLQSSNGTTFEVPFALFQDHHLEVNVMDGTGLTIGDNNATVLTVIHISGVSIEVGELIVMTVPPADDGLGDEDDDVCLSVFALFSVMLFMLPLMMVRRRA